jgi:hypothetical protein
LAVGRVLAFNFIFGNDFAPSIISFQARANVKIFAAETAQHSVAYPKMSKHCRSSAGAVDVQA